MNRHGLHGGRAGVGHAGHDAWAMRAMTRAWAMTCDAGYDVGAGHACELFFSGPIAVRAGRALLTAGAAEPARGGGVRASFRPIAVRARRALLTAGAGHRPTE